MWKIKGEEYQVGDCVFLVRGLFNPKVERFMIVNPGRRGGGGWFGGRYAHASNGHETVRIDGRGTVVDDILPPRRKAIPFSEGLEQERSQVKPMYKHLDPIHLANLDALDTTQAKIRYLHNEGFDEQSIAHVLHARWQVIREILSTPSNEGLIPSSGSASPSPLPSGEGPDESPSM
jgi:hypothetical protein